MEEKGQKFMEKIYNNFINDLGGYSDEVFCTDVERCMVPLFCNLKLIICIINTRKGFLYTRTRALSPKLEKISPYKRH